MDSLSGLQRWYESQCNGDWEHHHGISIETCDNPGWWVKVSLVGTSLEFARFESRSENAPSENSFDWLRCYVEEGVWNGAGGNLNAIIDAFLHWANAAR